jgi:hypothetical protein
LAARRPPPHPWREKDDNLARGYEARGQGVPPCSSLRWTKSCCASRLSWHHLIAFPCVGDCGSPGHQSEVPTPTPPLYGLNGFPRQSAASLRSRVKAAISRAYFPRSACQRGPRRHLAPCAALKPMRGTQPTPAPASPQRHERCWPSLTPIPGAGADRGA